MRCILNLFILSVLILSGCYKTPEIKEYITSYDYEYYRGYNAAIAQFGINNEDLYVSLDNKIVVGYSSDSEIKGYSEGYHKALEIIERRNNKFCPDIH